VAFEAIVALAAVPPELLRAAASGALRVHVSDAPGHLLEVGRSLTSSFPSELALPNPLPYGDVPLRRWLVLSSTNTSRWCPRDGP